MEYEIKLSKKELEDLIAQKKACKIAKNAYRLNVIILMAKGYSYQEIEDALLIDEQTARRYKKIYIEQGINGLFSLHYKGSESNLAKKQFEELSKNVEKNVYMNAKEISSQ